jgi:hypothetical protein
MHGDKLSYAQTLEEALLGLFEDEPVGEVRDGAGLAELATDAQSAFEGYLQALGEQRFEAAGAQLRRLSTLLERIKAVSSEAL